MFKHYTAEEREIRRECVMKDREGGMTFQKIGEKWNVSRERARQIYSNGLKLKYWRSRHEATTR